MEWLANETGREFVVATPRAGAGAAGDERNLFSMAEAENGLDFGSGVGEKDGAGHGAEISEGIAFVGVEFIRRSDEAAGADNGAEFVEEGGVHVRLEERILRWEKDGEVGAACLLVQNKCQQ